MNKERMRYIYHLDEIRQRKNMTVAALCKDICNERQYRKYLSGDNNISDKRIAEFCERLTIDSRDFYFSLNQKDNLDLDLLKNLYEVIVEKRDYKEGAKLLEEIDGKKLNAWNSKKLRYIKLKYHYDQKAMYPDQAVSILKDILDYPACKNNESFDFVDINCIQTLSDIEIQVNEDDGLNLLLTILNNPDVQLLTGENRVIMPTIYSNAAQQLDRVGRFEDSIEVATNGIKYCLKYNYHKSLTWLYYTKSCSLRKLNRLSDAEHYTVLALANLISRQETSVMNAFYRAMVNDFNKDPFEMLKAHKDIILEKKDRLE